MFKTISKVSLEPYEVIQYRKMLYNWQITASTIYNVCTFEDLIKLLQVECMKFNRPYNAKRIYQRICKVRRVYECANMKLVLADVEPYKVEPDALYNQIKLRLHMSEAGLEELARLLKTETVKRNRPYMKRLIYGMIHSRRRLIEKQIFDLKEI